MREIKIKFWDKVLDSWSKNTRHLITSGEGVYTPEIGNRYIPAFYTGLKDKNGKEIYEGDYFVIPDYPFYNDGLRNYIGEIYWDDTNYQWAYGVHVVSDRVRGAACGGGIYDIIHTDIEIIGNIHENPELLTPKE